MVPKSKAARAARNEKRAQAYAAAREKAQVKVAAPDKRPAAEAPRDGLAWLMKKRTWWTPAQRREALLYREGFSDAGEVAMRSSLELLGMAAGGGCVGMPDAAVFAMTRARMELSISRYTVLRGQVDLLTVMDGVCGHGYTLRYLAGENQQRALELEAALKIALDMLVAYRAGPPSAAPVSQAA